MNKKLIALVLAFALVFSSFTAAFADTTTAIPVDAQAAKDLGMLIGEGNGVTTGYLATTPTRLQAAIMFLRLKGLEQTALSYTSTKNFADADQVKWAGGKNIMAYLNNNPQLGWVGIGANKLNPNVAMTSTEFYKVMLETLGYKQNTTEVIGDFTWEGVRAFAATKGLSKVVAVNNFTVSDLATATIETLKATVKGGTKTLATTLVESGVITMTAAVAAGVYAAPADKTAPTVASITMTNLKQAVVVFNEKVDKVTAETAGNYSPAVSAVLGEDGKTVTLTLNAAIAANLNGSDVNFTVKNVKDIAGNVMADAAVVVKAFDVTLPVAEKIEVTGPQEIKVTFSEPMDASVVGTVLVDNGVYSATPVLSGKTLTITLGSALTPGIYNVKVSGYKDYAGFGSATKDFALTYAKDVVPVTASIEKATQEYVVVKFNKSVLGSQLTPATFYHTFAAWAPTSVTAVDGTTALVAGTYYDVVRLNFTAYPIPAGTTNVVVKKADGTTTAIVDQWGNKMASDATLSVTVSADTIAPTVTKVEAKTEGSIVITFSEDLAAGVGTGANLPANYVVKDSTGKIVTGVTPVYTNALDVYKTTLTVSPAMAGGNYTVEVKDVTDKSLAANKLATVTLTFAVTDKTAASISNTVVVEDTTDAVAELVYITFNEAMATTGAGSILDINNYQLDGTTMPTGSKVELFGSAKKVKLTIPAQTVTLIGNSRLTVGQLADVAGNKITALATAVTVVADVAPTTATVKTIALNKVMITISGLLSTIPADGITVTNNGTTHTLAAVSFTKDDTKTYITGTLNAAEALTGAAVKPTSVDVVANKLVTETGKKLGAINVLAATIVDGINPSYVSIAQGAVGSYNFLVTFDKNLAEIAASLTATEFVLVDKDGKTLTANVDYTTTVSANGITFQLVGAKYAAYTGNMTVSTKSAITYFGDNSNGVADFQPAADNAANVFTGKIVTIQ